MKYLTIIAALAITLFIGWPRQPHLTADELYGCTVKQQTPNGDCP